MPRSSLVVLLLIAGGCATYSAYTLPPVHSIRFGSTTEQHGMAMSVDWYGNSGEQRTYLGEDLASVGLLPILVLVENKGNQPWNLAPSELQLRTSDGKVEDEYPPASAAVLFVQPSSGMSNILRDGPYGWLYTLAGEPGAQASREADRARRDEFERKALPRGPINPGERRHGFVYFGLRGRLESISDGTLLLPLKRANGDILEISMPIARAPSANAHATAASSRLIAAKPEAKPEIPGEPGEDSVNCVSGGKRRWVRRSQCD